MSSSNVIAQLRELAAQNDNKLDGKLIDLVEKRLKQRAPHTQEVEAAPIRKDRTPLYMLVVSILVLVDTWLPLVLH